MVNAVVSGAGGRMGRRLIELVSADAELRLVGAVEHDKHPALGRDAGEVSGCGPLGVKVTPDFAAAVEAADVAIEFSLPGPSLEHLRVASQRGKAMVIGTTGFTEKDRTEIAELASRIPCFLSPNMSMGVNVVLKMLRDVAPLLGDDFDVEIVEAHHRTKVDAPSGTALRMAEVIAAALGRDLKKVGAMGRSGITGERARETIGVQAVRAGDIVGEHTVIFGGLGERIEIKHVAHSRDNFARGAIKATRWIVNQPPGLYSMEDLLGFK